MTAQDARPYETAHELLADLRHGDDVSGKVDQRMLKTSAAVLTEAEQLLRSWL